MQTLRPYQARAKKEVERAWLGDRSVLLVLPTGSGKTTVVAHLANSFPSSRVLLLCPARELVTQGFERFVEHGIDATVLMGGRRPGNQSCKIATVQSAARKTLGDFDLVIIDEAHRAVAKESKKVIRRYPRAKILGITATPLRLDGKPLGEVFDVLLNPISLKELQQQGYLVPLKVFAPERPLDLSKVKIDKRTRDYVPRSLAAQIDKPDVLEGAIQNWQRYAGYCRTFVYCISLAHAHRVGAQLQAAGIPSAVITGQSSPTERAKRFEQLQAKEIYALCNVQVLTEGIDFPLLECILLLRPTLSKALHFQILGRGHRTAPGKSECVVLDHADNFRRHGFPEEERTWTLRGSTQKGDSKRQPASVVRCPKCGLLMPASTRVCTNCANERLPVEGEGRLVEVKKVRWWSGFR